MVRAMDMPAAVATAAETAKRPRGRPRKTGAERDDGNRRAQLLRVAARLFRKKGFDATSTRDIAAAVGMRSGSPFYHFESKGALLYAVMEEGMRSAIARQQELLAAAGDVRDPAQRLHLLVRNHFQILLGPGSDFVPVMLYESRSITPRQRAQLADLQGEYEQPWLPVLQALQRAGRLHGDVKLARLLIFGALNWSAQWFDRRQGASLDDLADAALALFTGNAATGKPR
jgi:TetR/AcrR family transcriptional regulator, cholesterol catabolism regulator